MINLIKELKTLLELLRERLTNLTTKPHAEQYLNKILHLHRKKLWRQKIKTQPKQQETLGILAITIKPNNLPSK